MKQTASGWVILTRKLVAGFHPQNDNTFSVVTSVRHMEYSTLHSQSACPCHARDQNRLSFL